jgi:hypothetical protein
MFAIVASLFFKLPWWITVVAVLQLAFSLLGWLLLYGTLQQLLKAGKTESVRLMRVNSIVLGLLSWSENITAAAAGVEPVIPVDEIPVAEAAPDAPEPIVEPDPEAVIEKIDGE